MLGYIGRSPHSIFSKGNKHHLSFPGPLLQSWAKDEGNPLLLCSPSTSAVSRGSEPVEGHVCCGGILHSQASSTESYSQQEYERLHWHTWHYRCLYIPLIMPKSLYIFDKYFLTDTFKNLLSHMEFAPLLFMNLNPLRRIKVY